MLLLVLAVGAGFVLWLLPGWVEGSAGSAEAAAGAEEIAAEEPSRSASAVQAPPTRAPEARSPADTGADDLSEAALRRDARRGLETLAVAVERLEARDVESWGGKAWDDLERSSEQLQDFFSARDWQAAVEEHRRAAERVDALEQILKTTTAASVREGNEALARGDAATARRAFERALRLHPGHGEATAGLARARSWDRVAGLLADAEAAEHRGAWDEAERLFGRAAALDPASSEARAGVARNQGRRSRDAFGRAMGRGFEALSQSDFGAAKQAFDEAESLVGGKDASFRALADARAQLATAERLAQIEGLRVRGAEHEANEAWRQAETVYGAVLDIDGTIGFALEGLRRSRERAELMERLAFYLERPERMSTAEVLGEAERWKDRAAAVDDPGPELVARLAELEQRIRDYAAPVVAELRSDQLTEVWIYKVGKLGTFDRKSLQLRPGVYTVAGSREGFRDVRLQWVIEPGSEPEPLVVRCEDRI